MINMKTGLLFISLPIMIVLLSSTIVLGNTPPQYSNNFTSGPSIYDGVNLTWFNATWLSQDSNGFNISLLEINFNGSFVNYTMQDDYLNTSYWSGILPAGTWTWRIIANDSQNNQNATPQLNFTINRNTTNPFNIYFINSTGTYVNQNISLVSGSSLTANTTALYVNSGNASLYEDGVSVSNPRTTTFSTELHNYTGNITGNQNYTSNSSSLTFFVNIVPDNVPPTYSLNFTNSSVAGTAVMHSLNWTDNIGLSGYIFSFDNCTGTLTNDTWTSFSGNTWSNVTKTINSTTSCTIRWCVYANDTSNNWNGTSCQNPFNYPVLTVASTSTTTTTTTSTTTTTTSTTTTQATGQTGGTSNEEIYETVLVGDIPVGSSKTVNIFNKADLRIYEVTINAKNAISNARITVVLSLQPANSPVVINPSEGKVLKFIEIRKNYMYDYDISGATIKFQVSKNWTGTNNINESAIYLYRYNTSANLWTKLPTSKISDDSNYNYYQANSTGLSVFAIAGEKSTGTSTTTTTTEANVTTTTTTAPSLGTPLLGGVIQSEYLNYIITVVILMAIVVIILLNKKGKLKKLPEYLRKLKETISRVYVERKKPSR